MKPAPFEYHAPATIEEAVQMMASLDNPKALAGGQSLVPMMNFRYVMPDNIVDLNNVAALAGIAENGNVVRIGATTRQREVEFSDLIARRVPLFQAALQHVGHRQTRNRGTIGGSVAHADPSAESPTVLAAHDARIFIAGSGGQRVVPMSEFNLAFMTTAVASDELLVAIEIDAWPPGHGYSFQEFARRHGDFAIVGVACLLALDHDRRIERASLTLCGINIGPVRMHAAEKILLGTAGDRAEILQAADACGEIEAVQDFHASSDYRRHLARVLSARAIAQALERCKPASRN
jgi:carbon-monoxide dehydrogenase medium subunit